MMQAGPVHPRGSAAYTRGWGRPIARTDAAPAPTLLPALL
jgi:hypothetical protein